MANKNQLELLKKLRDVYNELDRTATDDIDFNDEISRLGIFKVSLDEAVSELDEFIEINNSVKTSRLKIANNDKLNIYNQVIKNLMSNDHNGTWDEILDDADGHLDYAIYLAKTALERIINEVGYEGEELEFYQNQLNKMELIKY